MARIIASSPLPRNVIVAGSGMAIVIVPFVRVSIGIGLPKLSERLVPGFGTRSIANEPSAAVGEMLNNTCPRPTVAPADTISPPDNAASEPSMVWPAAKLLIVGPKMESPAKT